MESTSVFDMSFGFLSLVTSEPAGLALYVELNGHLDLVQAFISSTRKSDRGGSAAAKEKNKNSAAVFGPTIGNDGGKGTQKSISIASIILGIFACSPSSGERQKSTMHLYDAFTPLFPSLEGIMTCFALDISQQRRKRGSTANLHLYWTKVERDEIELFAHALVIYLFLYRCSPQKSEKMLPLPLDSIFTFIGLRGALNDHSEGLVDLWCLALSGTFSFLSYIFILLL